MPSSQWWKQLIVPALSLSVLAGALLAIAPVHALAQQSDQPSDLLSELDLTEGNFHSCFDEEFTNDLRGKLSALEAQLTASLTQGTTPAITPASVQADQPADGQVAFRLCGNPDGPMERAMEQLIAGRSFRATLYGRSDGCADLLIAVSPAAETTARGSQTTSMSVSTSPSARLTVRITSENGTTRVSVTNG